MDEYSTYLRRLEAIENSRRRREWVLPAVLLFATVFTTLFAGALMQFVPPGEILRNPALLGKGAGFAFPLLIILMTHEMGHFIASKIHRVNATLPYFIPFPNYIGTFGAVIKMKSPMRNRRALLDIGSAGPLAGFVLSLMACYWGIQNMQAVPLDQVPEWSFWTPRIAFGNNLVLLGMYEILDVQLKPGFIYMNPLLDAGWLGMFVTSLNLIPAGQLDGGHISYALIGEKGSKLLAKIVVVALLVIGIPGFVWPELFWAGWSVWGILILVMGLKHPPPMDNQLGLDPNRKAIGFICLAIFILTFTPMPFQMF